MIMVYGEQESANCVMHAIVISTLKSRYKHVMSDLVNSMTKL